MNKVSKKILSLVLALALVVSTMTVTFAEANDKVTVTVTIERFTIGQGYLLKPTSVEVDKDASVKDVLEKVAQENNIKLNATTSSRTTERRDKRSWKKGNVDQLCRYRSC